jgi:hypothetical protein
MKWPGLYPEILWSLASKPLDHRSPKSYFNEWGNKTRFYLINFLFKFMCLNAGQIFSFIWFCHLDIGHKSSIKFSLFLNGHVGCVCNCINSSGFGFRPNLVQHAFHLSRLWQYRIKSQTILGRLQHVLNAAVRVVSLVIRFDHRPNTDGALLG